MGTIRNNNIIIMTGWLLVVLVGLVIRYTLSLVILLEESHLKPERERERGREGERGREKEQISFLKLCD